MGAFRPRRVAVMSEGEPPKPARSGRKLTVRGATAEERESIYRQRHEVYARELAPYSL